MPDYLFLMHADGGQTRHDDWGPYLGTLSASGRLQGGSAIGAGLCARKSGAPAPLSSHISGFIRVSAQNLADAQTLLSGNPVYETGGTVEIRELPRTD